MRSFQDTFKTRTQSFISVFSVFMTVPLIFLWDQHIYDLLINYDLFLYNKTLTEGSFLLLSPTGYNFCKHLLVSYSIL